MRYRIFFLITAPTLLQCNGVSESNLERAVPIGLYTITSPKCNSTKVAPEYPQAKFAAQLHDFDNLITHSVEITAKTVIEIISTKECTLTVESPIFSNELQSKLDSYIFSKKNTRTSTWNPADCQLIATAYSGESFPVNQKNSSLFADQTDDSEEIPYLVTRSPQGYYITSVPKEPFLGLWQNYGCETSDQIYFELIPKS